MASPESRQIRRDACERRGGARGSRWPSSGRNGNRAPLRLCFRSWHHHRGRRCSGYDGRVGEQPGRRRHQVLYFLHGGGYHVGVVHHPPRAGRAPVPGQRAAGAAAGLPPGARAPLSGGSGRCGGRLPVAACARHQARGRCDRRRLGRGRAGAGGAAGGCAI